MMKLLDSIRCLFIIEREWNGCGEAVLYLLFIKLGVDCISQKVPGSKNRLAFCSYFLIYVQ